MHPSVDPPPVPPVPLGPLGPTGAREREPILDVLRGFALLGILLVNIEFMRGSDVFDTLLGAGIPAPEATADRVTSFVVGWLISGKFVSAFSIMFGLGAALLSRRALGAGRSPVGLLARRYGWLLVFGVAHMLLLFPGDVLFVYGVTGVVLLAFVSRPPPALLRWSVGLLVGATLLFAPLAGLAGAGPVDGADPFAGTLATQRDRAVAALTDGSYLEVVGANAFLSALIQSGHLLLLPWFLALFLFGFALGRVGLIDDLRAHRPLLRRVAIGSLAVGLPLNLVLGIAGPLGPDPTVTPAWLLVAITAVQLLGAPVLAIGYLATVALVCLRWGPIRPLAATGRMALTAYLLQSLLALAVFWGLGFYDRLGATQALVVVSGIWFVVVVVSLLWMGAFRFGPVEWLWRALTYGRRQPLRGPDR